MNDVDLGKRSRHHVSSYVYDWIRENRRCIGDTSAGWSDAGCNGIVQRCREHPKEARYIHLFEKRVLPCCTSVAEYTQRQHLRKNDEATPLCTFNFSSDRNGSPDLEGVVKDLLHIQSAQKL
jgi:hypothetical protein